MVPAVNIVVIAPHPDDEAIGCGGTIVKHVGAGDRAAVLFVTSGDGCGDPGVREAEARAAAQVLGLSRQYFIQAPEGFGLSAELSARIKEIVYAERPAIIYVPHGNENDTNHQRTFLAARESLGDVDAQVYGYEIWTPLQRPGKYVNIDHEYRKKVTAIKKYKSQLKAVDYVDLALSLNRYRGAATGYGKYCEAFEKITWR
jgi:LmbE family N-acetylglucosaminyl deacetylase